MISAGVNIRSSADQLSKVTVNYLYDAIRNPKPEIAARLRQLRVVRQLNPTQYSELKRQLPYIVCSVFNPAYRKTENFAYTEYFIIDIDHISEKNLDAASLKSKLSQDTRVMLCFISPGGDGLKVMMKLSEKCYDASLYKVFYHLFAEKFAAQYRLSQVIDQQTCDVTRACFISSDADAFFNPQCQTIVLKEYIDPETNVLEALDLKHGVEVRERETASATQEASSKSSQNLDNDIISQIRQKLNPKAVKEKPPVYVPEELNIIMDDLKLYVIDKGVEITEVINISYGKKLRFRLGLKKAEINLFFGKRGFSVVQSPRTGTDSEMNELMAEVVESFLAEKVFGG